MNVLMVVLRLIHIFSAVLWIGATYSLILFVMPTAKAVGADAQKFMQHFTQRSGLSRVLTLAAVLTVLSGLLMYGYLFQGLAPLNTGSGLALTLGGLAGIAAIGSGTSTGGLIRRMQALGQQIAQAGGPPSPQQAADLAKLQEAMARRTALTAIFLTLALIGMTLSEYFAF